MRHIDNIHQAGHVFDEPFQLAVESIKDKNHYNDEQAQNKLIETSFEHPERANLLAIIFKDNRPEQYEKFLQNRLSFG